MRAAAGGPSTATGEGSVEFLRWLRELLSEPAKEYTQFAAGLTFLPALPPEEAVELLDERVRRLEEEIEEMRALWMASWSRLPRLFLIESKHELILREAELQWVRELVREISDGALGGMAEWEGFHADRAEGDTKRRRAVSEEVGLPRWLEVANPVIVALQRLGLVIGTMRLLSVPGRKSGRLRTTPVSPLTVDGLRYIVAGHEGSTIGSRTCGRQGGGY